MIKNIIKGINAYAGTFKLISRLGLWKYFGIPMLISFGTAILVGMSAWGFSDNLGRVMAKIWPWEWGAETFATVSTVFGGLVIIIIGLILYKHIILALSAPFMGPVSGKIEAHITGQAPKHRNTSGLSQLWRGIRINVRNLVMELLLTIPILIIGFIPIIGIISTVLLFLVQSYYAGFGNMDYTLERHFNVKDSVNFVKQNRGLAIGNGVVFMLMLLVPILGIILVLPLSVTAASSETVRILENSNRLKSFEKIAEIE